MERKKEKKKEFFLNLLLSGRSLLPLKAFIVSQKKKKRKIHF